MNPSFAEILATYKEEISRAHDTQSREAKISYLFLSFIKDAFDIKVAEMDIEHRVAMARGQKHGFIDALYRLLLIEFKRDIKANLNAKAEQLGDYMKNMPDSDRYVGILTDGIRFRTYVLDESGRVSEVDFFDLQAADTRSAYLWFDSYLFTRHGVEPTADDIVRRFGVKSPNFQLLNQRFSKLLKRLTNKAQLQVWRKQWSDLLTKVYGSDVGDTQLYIRHTYLCQFAKILAFAALYGSPRNKEVFPRIVNGNAFAGDGISNIGEEDFFSWLLLDEIREESVDLLYALSVELTVYDLTNVNQDLFKQLYQNLVDPETRHALGEFYTPDWLAELTLQEIDYRAEQRLLDPACGSGTFLFSAIRRLADGGLRGKALVKFALNNIVGIDVHPLAVTISRINYLIALSDHLQEKTGESDLFPIPVFMANALLTPFKDGNDYAVTVPVDTEGDEEFRIPLDSATDENLLTEIIRQLKDFAKDLVNQDDKQEIIASFKSLVQRLHDDGANPETYNLWTSNLHLLAQLIKEGRDSIWAYILNNVTRPLVLSRQKFDVVVGNPPWLAYRYITDITYQREVKNLSLFYGLIESNDFKLFTQIEMSTLFFIHARTKYLKADGILAS